MLKRQCLQNFADKFAFHYAKVGKRTLANLSELSMSQVEAIRAVLRGEDLRPVSQCFEVVASHAHGHVQAVALAMQRLGFAALIGAKSSRERDLVLAMVASRILAPATKLATMRWWRTTTLADEFGVADADEDELCAAMDWLLERQDAIQQKLAARHLESGGLVLYDLSSSYFEGETCPLALMVGDRGMIAQKAIDEMRDTDGIDWITALKSCRSAPWSSQSNCSSICSMNATCSN